jgi:hypothetical protein
MQVDKVLLRCSLPFLTENYRYGVCIESEIMVHRTGGYRKLSESTERTYLVERF